MFEGDEFTIQVIAKGSFVDRGKEDGNSYLIEVFTLRLNHVALNAWILSGTFNCRECYNTNEEWEAHKAKYKAKREVWNKQITEIVGINPDTGSISITQSQSEVFTVVHIQENEPKNLTTV
jgi:hypothetical protein